MPSFRDDVIPGESSNAISNLSNIANAMPHYNQTSLAYRQQQQVADNQQQHQLIMEQTHQQTSTQQVQPHTAVAVAAPAAIEGTQYWYGYPSRAIPATPALHSQHQPGPIPPQFFNHPEMLPGWHYTTQYSPYLQYQPQHLHFQTQSQQHHTQEQHSPSEQRIQQQLSQPHLQQSSPSEQLYQHSSPQQHLQHNSPPQQLCQQHPSPHQHLQQSSPPQLCQQHSGQQLAASSPQQLQQNSPPQHTQHTQANSLPQQRIQQRTLPKPHLQESSPPQFFQQNSPPQYLQSQVPSRDQEYEISYKRRMLKWGFRNVNIDMAIRNQYPSAAARMNGNTDGNVNGSINGSLNGSMNGSSHSNNSSSPTTPPNFHIVPYDDLPCSSRNVNLSSASGNINLISSDMSLPATSRDVPSTSRDLPSTSRDMSSTSRRHQLYTSHRIQGRRSPYEWMKRPSYQSQPKPGKTRTKDKYRVVYTDYQRLELEKEFHMNHYTTIKRKADLAAQLGLTERQIKIWFQNRRAKERKLLKKQQEQSRERQMRAQDVVAAVASTTMEAMTGGMMGYSTTSADMGGMLGGLIQTNESTTSAPLPTTPASSASLPASQPASQSATLSMQYSGHASAM
ncbi:hypothetical protein PUN28_015380 [Cardiocondyla obscurior]|uniref:Homeobox domain-containing protein n=4 Tax=Cardiocondyla obscurior TaxID=286306 RepID=A0AAW2EYP5_9HYME